MYLKCFKKHFEKVGIIFSQLIVVILVKEVASKGSLKAFQ